MKNVLIIAAILLVGTFAIAEAREYTERDYQSLFTAYVKKYNKEYSHDDFFNRFNIFKANYDFIHTHNLSNSTYSVAVNEFADLSLNEFHDRYTGLLPARNAYLRSVNAPAELKNVRAVDSIDWRRKNAVTPVKNQAQCGSCWAFSTTGAVEGANALKKGGKLVSLSEQQLIDCSTSEGNQGCNGGLMDQAFSFIISNKGLCAEESYAYTATNNTCQTTCQNVATVSAFRDIPQGDEKALVAALSTVGPVSIAIEADQQAFQFYSGGVMDGVCGETLDHGVLAVGFGTDADSKMDYIIVKNSWGDKWGENGYIRIQRGATPSKCGMADMASYPIA